MPEIGQQGQQPGAVPPPPAVDRMQRFTAANMIRSLLPLVLGCLLIVGFTALKQNPEDPVREVETESAERAASEVADYPLLVPRGLSEQWRPTSVRTNAGRASAGAPITLQIGFYTPAEAFAQYVVSDDRGVDALTDVLDRAEEDGSEQVDGQTWQRLTTERGETALTRTEGTATMLVTGSASDDELHTLAAALEPYAP